MSVIYSRRIQVIEEDGKPVAVIMDYNEYLKYKEIEDDRDDYYSAVETKLKNKEWVNHKDLKTKLGI
ncbi:hypothetical protein [Candidatus Magnetominusculus xianensis]|uniref:Antitoxin n=1 Tax=Candidatus Magnetominusculus xianensis TaxID=1748249 RepID=A0ABR5SKE6_9BACT|nr:hypothetical protein [Candidatus Magnetominusculus xianensis]KWT94600.1 hypothetical protein ASN18_0138 [Candidatus Magnetominusculus xianensis]MBF0403311.1 hypothetical protein [Nitrospirota bacterium]